MRLRIWLLPLLLLATAPAHATWPPRWTLAPDWVLTPSASWQYDALHADTDNGSLEHDGFRRQRTALTLAAPGGHSLKLDYDLTAGTWADAFVRVDLGEGRGLRLGQIKTPMGLEVLTSHRALQPFERSPAAVLIPGRRMGLEWARVAGNGSVAVAAIGDNIDQLARGHGLFARATRQIGSDPEGTRWHLGVAAGMEWPDSPQRLRGRPDVSGLPLVVADSGVLSEVDRLARLGLEAAWDRGPISLQAEHVEWRGERASTDVDARGSYLALSWRPSGEARRYGKGVFEPLQPAAPAGAWELVARVSRLQVERANGQSRSGHSFSVGANWYFNTSWRLQAQVSDSRGDGDPVDRIHGLRLHYQF